jgi:hypothetical protein
MQARLNCLHESFQLDLTSIHTCRSNLIELMLNCCIELGQQALASARGLLNTQPRISLLLLIVPHPRILALKAIVNQPAYIYNDKIPRVRHNEAMHS